MTACNSRIGLEAVLIDRDAKARHNIRSYLAAQGIRVAGEAENLAAGLHLVRSLRQGFVILELAGNPTESLEAVRRLRADLPHLGIVVSASEVSPELILRCMRAGAHEFLTRPLDIRELGEAIGRLANNAGPWTNSNSTTGKIITLFSAKGGTGVTSVAANLALALTKRGATTVLVDLDLQLGDAALVLDLQPSHTWTEVLHGSSVDKVKLRTMLTRHDSGLSMLASPTHLDNAETLTAVQVGEVLSLLQGMFEFVIVDAGRTFDPRPLEALNLADVVLLIGSPTVPAARNLRLGVEMLVELGLPSERLRFVLNRHQKRGGVSPADLQATVGLPVSWRIPADDRLMTEAINMGVPAVLGAARSELARAFANLAADVAELQIDHPMTPPSAAAA